jgi:hypothetical protein
MHDCLTALLKKGSRAAVVRHVAALALIALGVSQVVGAVCGIPALAAFGRSSVAAPAPLGFSHVEGVEPFAVRVTLRIETVDGEMQELRLDRQHFERLRGPLNRRYVYIRGIFYGSALGHDDEKQALYFGLCADGILARELGIDKPVRKALLQAITLTQGDQRSWTRAVDCAR